MDVPLKSRYLVWLIALMAMLITRSSAAEPVVVRLTSLEWPPYAGETLPDGGTQVALVRQAFAAVGVQLEVQFLPFRRAVQLARTDPTLAGYFPEYADVDDDFEVSTSLGASPLGLAYRSDRPITWSRVPDLRAFQPIGVVAGYLNEPELDQLAARRELRVEAALDDLSNLRRLIHGRVQIVVIDRAVMRWLVTNTPDLSRAGGSLQFHPRLLAERTLHVAFRRLPHGDAARLRLEQGLQQLDPTQIHPYTRAGP